MSLNTWSMALNVRTDKNAVYGMRDYLRQRGIITPMRDRDVVAKYLHRIIENGNARTGIDSPATVTRPLCLTAAVRKGQERDEWVELGIPPNVRERIHQLALGSFGLLVMLACYIVFIR